MAKTKTVEKPDKGYAGHIAGSRKGDVHREFDAKGEDAARKLGLELGLAPGTLSSWAGSWKRAAKKGTPAPKADAQLVADKPTPDKKAPGKKDGKAKGTPVKKVTANNRQTVKAAA